MRNPISRRSKHDWRHSCVEALESKAMLTTVVDLDLDGDVDLVRNGEWFENYDGAGNFTKHVISIESGDSHVADFNADGLPDILMSNGHVLQNLGGGNFRAASSISPDAAFANYHVFDLGGDGDLDIAAVTSDQRQAYVFENVGEFQFRESAVLPLPSGVRSLADVDLDGDVDLVIPENRGDFIAALNNDLTPRDIYLDAVWYYQNDGNGNFVPQALDGTLVTYEEWQFGVTRDANSQEIVYVDEVFRYEMMERFRLVDGYLADVNGDGKQDVVVARFYSNIGPVTWQTNLDGVSFGEAQFLGDTGHGSVMLSDFDQDGDLDVLNTDGMSYDAMLRVNSGAGFVDSGLFPIFELPGVPETAADLNGDGKLDMIVSSSTHGIPNWMDGATLTMHQNIAAPPTPAELIADLQLAIRTNDASAAFDYTRDGLVDQADLEYLVRLKIRSTFGDANLDNLFNSSDLVQVFEAGEYEDAIAGNSTWQTGDWNGDGEFDSSDLVFALQFAGYETDADQVLVYAFQGDVTTANLADNSLQKDVLPSLPEAEFGSQNNRFSSQNIAVSPEGQIARLALRTDNAFPAADLLVYNASGSLLSRNTFAEFGTVQFSPDGTLFVLHPHSIQRYSVSDRGELASLGTFPAQNSNLWNPQIAFGSDGYIYLANFYSNSTGERRLTRYDAQTGQLDPNFMVPIWLDKMKFASNGLLYTAFSNTQQVVDTSTGSVSSLGPFTSDSISSFTLGRDDEVLVLSYWYDDASGQYRSAVDRYSIITTEHLGRAMTLDGIQGGIEYWPG